MECGKGVVSVVRGPEAAASGLESPDFGRWSLAVKGFFRWRKSRSVARTYSPTTDGELAKSSLVVAVYHSVGDLDPLRLWWVEALAERVTSL